MLSFPAAAQEYSLARDLEACVDGLRLKIPPDQQAEALFVLKEACPEAARTLLQYPLTRLVHSLRIDVDTAFYFTELRELARLALLYEPREASSRGLDTEQLKRLAAEIQAGMVKDEPGWWERFVLWLESWWSSQDPKDRSDFTEWLKRLSIPPGLIEAMLYFMAVIVVMLAGWVIYRELSVASRAKKRIRDVQTLTVSDTAARTVPSWLAAASRPPDERAGILLTLIWHHLMKQGHLSYNWSLTNQQMLTKLSDMATLSTQAATEITRTVEEAVYGRRPLQEAEVIRLAESAAGSGLVDARSLQQ